jgi:glycosyltransferase involved in cell wall biosynthesis
VHVNGGYDDRDLAGLLAAAHVVVSTSHTEGLPVSLLEASAAGLPVVATDVGGVGELVTDGSNGLLIPPGDAQAAADALKRLAGDETLRVHLAEQARRSFETSGHSPAGAADHALDLYRQAQTHAANGAGRRTRVGPLRELYGASYGRLAPTLRRLRSVGRGG